jgi:outer membrane protein OmpA-like peptidoglycan-associated protein
MTTKTLAGAIACVAILSGCGISAGVEHDRDAPGAEATATPTARAAATPTSVTSPSAARPVQVDEPCNGRPGVDIEGVDIPQVKSDPIEVPDQKLGDDTVPGFVIPGVEIPAQHVPAQCAVRERAPAGCIGAVEIPEVTIPAVTIPAVTIPAVEVNGEILRPAVSQPAVTSPAVTRPARRTPAVCAQKPRPGSAQGITVAQEATVREALVRRSLVRPVVIRRSVCRGRDCVPEVTVPPISVAEASVGAVFVGARTLTGDPLPDAGSRCVDVLNGKDETAYDVCSDVLFDFDKAAIRPDAEPVLRVLARSLRKRAAGRRIRIDGHTDSKGGDAYNRRLSLRRAESVRRWLAGHGVDAARAAVEGYGETRPVASNATSSGRQKNRRVVIGVTR